MPLKLSMHTDASHEDSAGMFTPITGMSMDLSCSRWVSSSWNDAMMMASALRSLGSWAKYRFISSLPRMNDGQMS